MLELIAVFFPGFHLISSAYQRSSDFGLCYILDDFMIVLLVLNQASSERGFKTTTFFGAD